MQGAPLFQGTPNVLGQRYVLTRSRKARMAPASTAGTLGAIDRFAGEQVFDGLFGSDPFGELVEGEQDGLVIGSNTKIWKLGWTTTFGTTGRPARLHPAAGDDLRGDPNGAQRFPPGSPPDGGQRQFRHSHQLRCHPGQCCREARQAGWRWARRRRRLGPRATSQTSAGLRSRSGSGRFDISQPWSSGMPRRKVQPSSLASVRVVVVPVGAVSGNCRPNSSS